MKNNEKNNIMLASTVYSVDNGSGNVTGRRFSGPSSSYRPASFRLVRGTVPKEERGLPASTTGGVTDEKGKPLQRR